MIRVTFTLCLTLLAGCASAIPFPDEKDVTKAQERWKDVSLNDLQTGRKIYIEKCSGCHSVRPPEHFSEQKWTEILPVMSEKAKLKNAENEYLKKYLLIMSTRLFQ